jgi:hypothetical protein
MTEPREGPGDWAPPTILQEGQRELERYVREGYAPYLVAGVAGVGKTEMLVSYERQLALRRDGTYLGAREGRSGSVESTTPGTLNCFPVAAGGRKVVLIDASGEHFKGLYPYLRQAGRVNPDEVDFLRLLARHLRGLALLIDLKKLWQRDSTQSDAAQQVEIAVWILMLLRWLRYDGRYDETSPIAFQDDVSRKLKLMRRRLKVPVLVLFSLADQLVNLTIPARPDVLQRENSPARLLVPAWEDPLLFAYHCVPTLFGGLMTHCDQFRFDFAHSLVLSVTGAIGPRIPCGIRESLGWLVDADWRWPALPTRFWVGVEKRLDAMRGRAIRWERLPEPRQSTGR